jgi:hypothetical protein
MKGRKWKMDASEQDIERQNSFRIPNGRQSPETQYFRAVYTIVRKD